MLKKLIGSLLGVWVAVCSLYFVSPPLLGHSALGAANALMALGVPAEQAKYITANLVNVDSSGNLVLPAASGKKVSFTAEGTEYASVSSSGLSSSAVVSTGQITGTGLVFPVANYETLAGAGTTVADAAALSATKHIHQITGANGTVGWKFAASTAGQFEILLNGTAGVAKIYANTGGTVNGGSVNAAFSALTGIKPILCISTAVDTWICA